LCRTFGLYGVKSDGAEVSEDDISAKMVDFSEELQPFFNDLFTSGLNNGHDVPQNVGRNLRIIVAQEAFARLRDPDFCGIAARRSLRNMNVYRRFRSPKNRSSRSRS